MNKEYILLLETATEACSVALSCGEEIIAEKYTEEPKAHASLIGKFISEILLENNITVKDLSAVAVSEGPGSYTGLRVGVSCAKGLCYGAKRPLIAVNTLEIIAQCAIDSGDIASPDALIVPMIDARRMEVYTTICDAKGRPLTQTEAKILDETSFAEQIGSHTVLFTGNGAEKFGSLLASLPGGLPGNISVTSRMPHAKGMRVAAYARLQKKEFEDTAYFEPFYLKDFVAGKPKKLL